METMLPFSGKSDLVSCILVNARNTESTKITSYIINMVVRSRVLHLRPFTILFYIEVLFMNSHVITCRLTDEEYQILKTKASTAGANTSQYIKSLISNNDKPTNTGQLQKLATKLCELQILLVAEHLEENASIATAVNNLWQCL